MTLEYCDEVKLERVARTYTAFLNALERYADKFGSVLRRRMHALADDVAIAVDMAPRAFEFQRT